MVSYHLYTGNKLLVKEGCSGKFTEMRGKI